MDYTQEIQLSEVFGPTIQGEGVDVGRACLFIRTQGCPVKCPGCDTAYTWDGSEKGTRWHHSAVKEWALPLLQANKGLGIVVTGGEPLIHYKHVEWRLLLEALKQAAGWISLETSGFIGPRETQDPKQLIEYLQTFTTVHCSPKVTPCLRGPLWVDEQMDVNLHWLLQAFGPQLGRAYQDTSERLAFKYVVKEQADVDAVLRHVDHWGLRYRRHPLFLMPYGIEANEVRDACIKCVEWCAKYDFRLSPRLHALLYGKKRGV